MNLRLIRNRAVSAAASSCLAFVALGETGSSSYPQLPDGFQPVEYVQSTAVGKQYVLTSFDPGPTTRWVLDAEISNKAGYMGCRNAKGGKFMLGVRDDGTGYFAMCNTTGAAWMSEEAIGVRKVFELKGDGSVLIGEAEISTGAGLTAERTCGDGGIALFADNQSFNIDGHAVAKIYSCRFYDGDDLVHDLVPCIDLKTSLVGFYDVAEGSKKTFYFNEAATPLVAPVAVKAKAHELAPGYVANYYIQSSGSEYVLTDVAPGPTIRYVIDAEILSGQMGWIAGSSWNERCCCGALDDRTGYYVQCSTVGAVSTLASELGCRKVFDIRGTGKISIDGEEFEQPGLLSPGWEGYGGFALFAINQKAVGGQIAYHARAKVFSCKIYDGSKLIRDLRPCTEVATGRAGFYDLCAEEGDASRFCAGVGNLQARGFVKVAKRGFAMIIY